MRLHCLWAATSGDPHPSLPVLPDQQLRALTQTQTQYSDDEQGTLGLPVLLCVCLSLCLTIQGRDERSQNWDVPGDYRLGSPSAWFWAMLNLWVHCPQVPFFLFIVFVVYALLPLSTRAAITVGMVSTVSHLLMFGAVTGAFKMSVSGAQLALQVRATDAGCGQVRAWWRLNSGTVCRPVVAGRAPSCLS